MRLDGLHHVTAITADVATNLNLIGDLESRRKELERRFPLLPNPRSPTRDRQDRHMTSETSGSAH